MNDMLSVYYMNERCPTFTVNFRLDLLIKHGLLGEIQKIVTPKFHFAILLYVYT